MDVSDGVCCSYCYTGLMRVYRLDDALYSWR